MLQALQSDCVDDLERVLWKVDVNCTDTSSRRRKAESSRPCLAGRQRRKNARLAMRIRVDGEKHDSALL